MKVYIGDKEYLLDEEHFGGFLNDEENPINNMTEKEILDILEGRKHIRFMNITFIYTLRIKMLYGIVLKLKKKVIALQEWREKVRLMTVI